MLQGGSPILNRTLQFFTPPSELQVGGLKVAIDGMISCLEGIGWEIHLTHEDQGLRRGVALLHIHGLWRPKSLSISRAARKHNIPYVISPHGMLEPWARKSKRWKKGLYFQLFERSSFLNASAILATSKQESRNLAAYCPQLEPLISTISLGLTPPSGVPSRDACRTDLGISDHERILVYLSRIDRKKGLDLLIRALAKQEPKPGTRLLVVGDGDERFQAELNDLVTGLSCQLPPVEFVGPVWGDAKWKYLRAADLFCLPTHSENFGFAVLEAAMVGTPILTTDQTPWVDWGKDQELLHIASPTLDGLNSALNKISLNVDTKARSQLSGWALENFQWNQLASQYDALYRSLISGASNVD